MNTLIKSFYVVLYTAIAVATSNFILEGAELMLGKTFAPGGWLV